MKKLNTWVLLITLIGVLFSCNDAPSTDNQAQVIHSGWRSVYKHDGDGNRIHGNIDSLIMGIRSGYDVRIGWGWERERGDSTLRLEHVAQPLYLSIIQEKEVSAIIDAHPLLQSYLDINNQQFGEGGHLWQCVLTTRGTFNAQVHDRSTGELLRDWPQRHTMTWFIDFPSNAELKNVPLY